MQGCKFSEKQLQLFVDGQIDADVHAAIDAHVDDCVECHAKVESWRDAGMQLRNTIDDALGEVDPLRGLQGIRARIAAEEEASLGARLGAWWRDVWAFNRRAVAGVGLAAAIGALSAPAVTFWMGDSDQAVPHGLASVEIESLEFDGNATASVHRPDEAMTIIWVEHEVEE